MVAAVGEPFTGLTVKATPLQTVAVREAMTGVGFIVIVNTWAAPGQPFAVGVTVTVPEIGALVVLELEKAAIFPVPLAARPIAVFVFVQLNTVPATLKALKNVITGVVVPAQNA